MVPGLRIVISTYRSFVMVCDDMYKIKKKAKTDRKAIIAEWIEEWGGNPNSRALVLDESHSIKNPSARQTKLVSHHSELFGYRYLLSGTPAPNGPHEFYSQIKVLSPAMVPPTYAAFLQEIAETGDNFSATAIMRYKPEGVKRYDEVFKSISLRWKTKDVLDLPPIVIENVYVPLSPKQRRIYEGMVSSTLFSLKEHFGELKPKKVQQAFPYMSMALDNPCLIQGRVQVGGSNQDALDSWMFADHGKLDVCAELLRKYIVDEGRKVLLFDFHPRTLDALAEYFHQYNPLVVHGENGGKDKVYYRDEVRKMFQNPDSPNKLLVGSMDVLTTSITLTAATVVIYFSRNYSLMRYLQSMKRAHRIGSEEPVIVHPLIFENSLNIYQDATLRFKKAYDDNFSKLTHLTDAEWRDIFDGRNIRSGSASVEDLGYDLVDLQKEDNQGVFDFETKDDPLPERWRV
jgi:SNF2 family DNA or RNA helicase